MWWWRRVRVANIPEVTRREFERYGESVVARGLASPGLGITAGSYLMRFLNNHLQAAQDWLTERRDIHERREQRLETVEWAILIFVVLGVLTDVVVLIKL